MEIIERSAIDLAGEIREGELTSREVVQAHVTRARWLNPDLKAVAADRFDAALAEADEADARVKRGGDRPPFLGVPCTIKESFAVEGMPNAAGLVHRREHRAHTGGPGAARPAGARAEPP